MHVNLRIAFVDSTRAPVLHTAATVLSGLLVLAEAEIYMQPPDAHIFHGSEHALDAGCVHGPLLPGSAYPPRQMQHHRVCRPGTA